MNKLIGFIFFAFFSTSLFAEEEAFEEEKVLWEVKLSFGGEMDKWRVPGSTLVHLYLLNYLSPSEYPSYWQIGTDCYLTKKKEIRIEPTIRMGKHFDSGFIELGVPFTTAFLPHRGDIVVQAKVGVKF